MNTFQSKLVTMQQKNNSLVCVGLDSDWDKLPAIIKKDPYPQFSFNKAIIEATHDLVCAYKPNSAFYEGFGSEGVRALKMTCDYLKEAYPNIPIILDAKRADIGSTNKGFVEYAYEYLGVHGITLHPYLGSEALQPFLDQKDKGCIILVRTSNPGAGEFQDRHVDGEPLYRIVAKTIIHKWNKNNNCLMVIGATYPEELAEIRKLAGDMTFLVPGIGAQGGEVEKTIKAGLNSKKAGMIVNSSRSIIFASNKDNFADKAREETKKLQETINNFR